MLRRLPVIPTLLVVLAVGVMVRLGFWQLERLAEKEAMLAQYSAAQAKVEAVELGPNEITSANAYRRVIVDCDHPGRVQFVAGHNASGATGWANVIDCRIPDIEKPTSIAVVIGWSAGFSPAEWPGQIVTGRLVPGKKAGVTLMKLKGEENPPPFYVVADPPLLGLDANAKPDPANIPNNHLSYAIQWFLFALTALVIYGLALRKRLSA